MRYKHDDYDLSDISFLKPKHRLAIRLRFGLNKTRISSSKELASALGVGKEHAHRIVREALIEIKYRMKFPLGKTIPLDCPLTHLPFGSRAQETFSLYRLKTLGELLEIEEERLVRFQKIGKITVRHIVKFLTERNMSLKKVES